MYINLQEFCMRELTIAELKAVSGGASDTNVLKTKHDTAKNSVGNIR
jgi:bacteriocin-like protein